MVQPRAGTGGVVQIALRLPVEMRDKIKEAAFISGRSINSEILARLEASFAPATSLGELEQRLSALEANFKSAAMRVDAVNARADEILGKKDTD